MSLETTRECPACDEETTFWRAASTEVHIGVKEKWRCSECDRTVVRIGDGSVDSAAAN